MGHSSAANAADERQREGSVSTLPEPQLSFDELGTPLRSTTFVVVDLETTGTSPDGDAITEIAAVKIRGGEVLGEFATLVNPGREISPTISVLTGITQLMVVDAPRIEQVLPAFFEFARGAVLVAHNAPFDVGFLKAASKRHGQVWPKPVTLCTVRLARRVLTREEAPSCRLSALAELFQAATQPVHRALADARATVDVLHGLLERVGPLGVHSLEELLGYLPEVTPQQRRKRELARHLPHAPGVYLFRGPGDEVLYVGTSGDLRRRVRGYFTASEGRKRLREMVNLAVRVDAVVCAHTLEAQVRELRLLGAHRPPYNRRSKKPNHAWWVWLTEEAFPRLSIGTTPHAGALGPFRSRGAAQDAVETILEAARLRSCTPRISLRKLTGSPCAAHELGRCGAPCAGKQDVADYAPAVEAVRRLFAGLDTEILGDLRDALELLARSERFEEAAVKRDRLSALIKNTARAQRLAALAAIEQLVAAQPDGAGGWHFAVIRHGRLASAGTARRGLPPMPIVEQLIAAAETVLPGTGPLHGAPAEEIGVLHRWLSTPDTRLVRTTHPWSCPVSSAAAWTPWITMADTRVTDLR
ncbi:DEDD exnuclease domain-containing protein [Pseudonocardiaceae bacterium YIM PH 21723]|nr:DEDD exnuclease domain-containing protein [Pseudonocardiaceae bacterium YIM PH 21723]